MRRTLSFLCLGVLFLGCSEKPPKHFRHEVLNAMTPIKNQGESQLCWVYAMLAAIETEHLRWGDSVNLSPAYIEKKLELEPLVPSTGRGMGATLISLIQKHGVVGYDAMPTVDKIEPQTVFMYGMAYTPQEFARSVCAPGEYLQLTSTDDEPYGEQVQINLPDNWLHQRFLNVPIDTLLKHTVRAVRRHHGVCWESRSHAMAIVGLARDDRGHRYFVMKNSWGDEGPYHGLAYLSFGRFRSETLAVEMTHDAYNGL